MRKNSIKNTRINGEVQKELSSIIRGEIKDPRIHPMTSVMAVEVAPDLKTCKAYISVLGNQEAKEATIRGLNSAEGYIRRQLARNLNLRNTPEIRFILDESIEYGVNMSKLIDDVAKRDASLGKPAVVVSFRLDNHIVCTSSHRPVRDSSGPSYPASVCWEHLRNRPSGMVYYCHSQRKITANRPCKSVEGMSDIKEDAQ